MFNSNQKTVLYESYIGCVISIVLPLEMEGFLKRLIFLLGIGLPLLSHALDLQNSIFDRVGQEKGLDPYILYAVALAESAYSPINDGTVAPYPYTLRTRTTPFYGRDLKDTQKKLVEILKNTNSVDVGMMQINVRWHAHRVKNPLDLLDVETNLQVAADILNERLRANQNNWEKSLAQYHSFDSDRGQKYAKSVLAIYSRLVNNQNSVLVW